MTSSLGSKKIDVKKYGCIYAASQKNIGVAGCGIAIIRNELIKEC